MTRWHLDKMKTGAVLCNMGQSFNEIDMVMLFPPTVPFYDPSFSSLGLPQTITRRKSPT